MKKHSVEGALACVGAVIGAGFVSGREVISFFSRYGGHSWWLITLSVAVMMILCTLCMRRAGFACRDNWCDLYMGEYPVIRWITSFCAVLLLVIIGGAMVSAAGHMVMLLWPSEWAYSLGAVGTLGAAWLLSGGGVKPLAWVSSVLTMVLLLGMLMMLKADIPPQTVAITQPAGPLTLGWAAVRAVAYASMNMAIAIGVVCRIGCGCSRRNDRQSALFGLLMISLLFISNHLYLKHPELMTETFPVVRLFINFGRTGYVMSVILLYLAVFSTLIAVVYALKMAISAHIRSKTLACAVTLGSPLAVSAVGFMSIVDELYAPIGLLCLGLMFAPLMLFRQKSAKQG